MQQSNKTTSEKKIIICGGHLSPALALMEELLQRKKYSIYYIGRKYALEGDKAISLEYKTVKNLPVAFYEVNPPRLQRTMTRYTISSLCKFPFSMIRIIGIIKKIKPDFILSFGGYVALPVALAGNMMGIPVVTHEQSKVFGLSNRIISRFARAVCLSWEGTRYAPVGPKVMITGNPMRPEIYQRKNTEILNFGNTKLPLLYITGGSLGARSMNNIIGSILKDLLTTFRILHQTGSADHESDFHILSEKAILLPVSLRENYRIVTHINPDEVSAVLNTAILVIGRSGANTVTELAALAKPSILIPLPWSGEKEQEYNAKMLEDLGLATIIYQNELSGERLLTEIKCTVERIKSGQFRKLTNLAFNGAARKIADLVA